MAVRGQRFTLDPDADNFTFNVHEREPDDDDQQDASDFVKEIRERETTDLPPPPKPKKTKTGFPQPRQRGGVSTSQSQSQSPRGQNATGRVGALPPQSHRSSRPEPSDRAIINQVSRKYGLDLESKEKQEISEENKRRIAQMSTDDIEEARAEIMSSLSPAFIERLLKRANLDEGQSDQNWQDDRHGMAPSTASSKLRNEKTASSADELLDEGVDSGDEQHRATASDTPSSQPHISSKDSTIEPQFREVTPSIHFPIPTRNPDDYVPLDPDSPSFLSDLKKHYFPSLPDNPSTLAWLQDPTEQESNDSPYAPEQSRYAPSDIRFDFTGRLLPPKESREVPVSKGLHHHGEAPESAGYTIPELSILARSSLPNQRCVAYQVLGRVLYRLGRGDFGPRGTELQEGLWSCIEKERPIEVMMSEANRVGGHMSAKAYATEALWLWRKGGGGDRGVLKPGETLAK